MFQFLQIAVLLNKKGGVTMNNIDNKINELVAKMVENGYDACNASSFSDAVIRMEGIKLCNKIGLTKHDIQEILVQIGSHTGMVATENHSNYELIKVSDRGSIDLLEKFIDVFALACTDEFDLDEELKKVNPIKALKSGKITKDYIGRIVHITNSNSPCQEWKIADVNHDGTTGTVDLFPVCFLNEDRIKFDSSSQNYGSSDLRSWLNCEFYDGFTDEVKEAMVKQTFMSNGEILKDKVKCPSLVELGLGLRCDGRSIDEGSMYPIFGDAIIRPNKAAIYKAKDDGETYSYHTRSRYIGNSNYVWNVGNNGYCGSDYYSYSYYVVACIRF